MQSKNTSQFWQPSRLLSSVKRLLPSKMGRLALTLGTTVLLVAVGLGGLRASIQRIPRVGLVMSETHPTFMGLGSPKDRGTFSYASCSWLPYLLITLARLNRFDTSFPVRRYLRYLEGAPKQTGNIGRLQFLPRRLEMHTVMYACPPVIRPNLAPLDMCKRRWLLAETLF